MNILTTSENKELLWNVLYNNNVFSNIPNNKINMVQQFFENNIEKAAQSTHINGDTNSNILELNKTILKNVCADIDTYKKTLLESNNVKTEFKEEKLLIFDKKLEEKKESFNSLIKMDKPEEIKFGENIDAPIENDEMNKRLEEMQKERHDILPPQNSTEKSASSDLEELIFDLDNENIDQNQNQNIDENKNENQNKHLNLRMLKKQVSKIDVKDIGNLMKEEYKMETNVTLNKKVHDLNTKFNEMNTQLELILKNQELIMKKLNLNL